ncbi:hypothetical protein [Streptomyces sp. NPDC020597]|uniref:hypothetical protein n=1 Tax=unclassified Streptomyces TaxID=2593676 RepID=UPI003794D3A3
MGAASSGALILGDGVLFLMVADALVSVISHVVAAEVGQRVAFRGLLVGGSYVRRSRARLVIIHGHGPRAVGPTGLEGQAFR